VDAGNVVAAETPEVAKGVVIVPEISDTRLLCAARVERRESRRATATDRRERQRTGG
jgi:hypothetical protein